MPRGLTTEQKTALAARIRAPLYFVELLLDTPVRLWSGVGDTTALGETWLGVGEFGIINGIESDASLKASAVSMALHGVPSDAIDAGIIAETREIHYQGKGLKVYLGFGSLETGVPLTDPVIIWAGVADTIAYNLGDSITVALTGEHYSSRMRRANGARMTTQSHNARFDLVYTDLFFEPQNRLMGVPRVQI